MSKEQQNWAQIPEKKGLWGMRLMVRTYALFGRRVFMLLLLPVILVFYLSSPAARQASRAFLRQVDTERSRRARPGAPAYKKAKSTFRHFYSFGLTLLDKISSWQGRLRLGKEVVFAEGSEEALNSCRGGMVMMVSHLGDIELCRALVTSGHLRKVTALVFHANAQRFSQVMAEFAPDASVNLIALKDFGPELAVTIKDLIDEGHIVAIAADRLAVPGKQSGNERVVYLPFLGREAPFAQGPWILASLMGCPVMSMFALREGSLIKIYAHKLCDRLTLKRGQREESIKQAAQGFVSELERHALRCPYEWFNFYDFWARPDAPVRQDTPKLQQHRQKRSCAAPEDKNDAD